MFIETTKGYVNLNQIKEMRPPQPNDYHQGMILYLQDGRRVKTKATYYVLLKDLEDGFYIYPRAQTDKQTVTVEEYSKRFGLQEKGDQ